MILCLVCFAFILSRADGDTDPFYIRFTTPKQENMILGTSRAAQGIIPQVLDNKLKKNFFNYAFTVAHSPFGEVYLKSIKAKLNSSTKNGIFIISVDPWSICSTTEDPNDSSNFRENNLCLANTPIVDMNPNFIYLIKNLKGKYFTVITKTKGALFLHKDGWLEVTLPMDSVSVKTREDDKIEMYKRDNLPYYKFSDLRLEYLKKTIEFLNSHGDVYLVRLPIPDRMMKLENKLMPGFSDLIEKEVAPLSRGFFDMTTLPNNFQFTDGNHLYKTSGKIVTEKIAEWISTLNRK